MGVALRALGQALELAHDLRVAQLQVQLQGRPGPPGEGLEIAQVVDGHEDGFFLGPCLFDRVDPKSELYRDEIFGPVLSVVRAASYDEAVALVNESPFGNGVALFTRDGGAARRFELEIEAGMVGINVAIPVPVSPNSDCPQPPKE